MEITESQANLKLMVLNSNAMDMDRIDIITRLTNAGLPQEVITRIEDLWEKTKEIAGEIVNIGKIILSEILNFIEANPHMAVGMALGAALGALTAMIPFIGPLLAPLVTVVAALFGGVVGASLDRGDGDVKSGVVGATQEAIVLAKKFFELFAKIINALTANYS
jgi:hypothetical protein